jgi:5-amino-6-(5-phosphoribosylamino)uracil reductase
MPHPHTTVILAMSADGKIADVQRSPARFGSPHDKAHLEQQVAQADAVLFGAGTLRAYGTTLSVRHPDLLQTRQQRGQAPQPVQIVCSRSAQFDRTYRFFSQSVPRWLLTTPAGAALWSEGPEFERVMIAGDGQIDLGAALTTLAIEGYRRLAVLGGGTLVGALFAAGLIDELWLTICPLILGGDQAPTAVGGQGFLATAAPDLDLLEVVTVGPEVFLHYQVSARPSPSFSKML